MIERREHLRFALEAREPLRIVAKAGGRILIATSRSSFVSRARYTSPMPPTPSRLSMRNTPICVPIARPSISPRVDGRSVAARSINAASVPDFNSDSTSARSSASFAHSEASAVGRSGSGFVNTAP